MPVSPNFVNHILIATASGWKKPRVLHPLSCSSLRRQSSEIRTGCANERPSGSGEGSREITIPTPISFAYASCASIPPHTPLQLLSSRRSGGGATSGSDLLKWGALAIHSVTCVHTELPHGSEHVESPSRSEGGAVESNKTA